MKTMTKRNEPRKSRSQLLQWFLEFLNLDLDQIGRGERAKWAVEISGLLGGRVQLEEIDNVERPSVRQEIADYLGESVQNRINLELYQKELRILFGIMTEMIERTTTRLRRGWTPLEEADLLPSFNRFSSNELSVNIEGVVNWWEERTETTSDGKVKHFFNCPQEAIDNMTIGISFSTSASADALKFHFALALEGTPISAFRKCQECGRMFLHLSRREKIFCSNLCASRYGVRKRRKKIKNEDPMAYQAELKVNAERAHKRYTQRLQSSGKPARRPYKHKTEKP